MFLIDRLLLVAAVLVIFGILSSKFSARVGLPVLVLFVAVGMLAGSDGIGGIEFENWVVAHGIGTVALAIILFDGGLRTSLASFKLALRPALSLATVGVFLTAGITGAVAAWLFELPLLAGFLLGSLAMLWGWLPVRSKPCTGRTPTWRSTASLPRAISR
mgnify:CR=1 FL=1